MIANAMTVAVVIPAFNEAASIGQVVRAVCQQAVVATVIVVDDGSRDDTARRVVELFDQYSHKIQLLTHTTNRGKGFALATGIAQALASEAQWIITFDADDQHDAADIPRLLHGAECAAQQSSHPLIIAVRQVAPTHTPQLRRFANRFADFWISWVCGQPITDTQSGLRLYPAALLTQLPTKPQYNQGFRYETALLIDAVAAGAAVYRVDVANRYQHGARPSHYRPWHDTWSITRLVAIRLLRRGLHPLGLIRVVKSGVMQLILRKRRWRHL